MPAKTVVAISKVEQKIETAVIEAIHLAGGLDSIISRGDKIYLKPNFVAPRSAACGVTTNLEIIRVVAEEVRRCGGRPILYETPAMEFDKKTVYDVLGIYDFAKQHGIHLIEGPQELKRIPIKGGKVFKSVKIPRILHRAKIINIPKLKTHVSAKMTCGMKNLIGLLPDSEKRRVHVRGIHPSIADINKVIQPVFSVVDATTCMEGDGPTYGDAVELNLILSGRDTVAVDKVCSGVVGVPWRDVGYLQLADGRRPRQQIDTVGASIEDVKVHLKIPEKNAFYHLSTRMIHILDVVFSKVSSQHLNQFLFGTGYFGTNPKILKEMCNACGDCVKVCPVEKVIDIEIHKIYYNRCIRCLNCFFACDRRAIAVGGFSRPDEHIIEKSIGKT